MSSDRMKVETLSEFQIWIEGQFALVRQTQTSTADDVKAVRSRVHDLGNEVQKLLALDLEGKIRQLDKADKEHNDEIRKLIDDLSARRGALAMLRTIYLSAGGIAGAVITLLLQRVH